MRLYFAVCSVILLLVFLVLTSLAGCSAKAPAVNGLPLTPENSPVTGHPIPATSDIPATPDPFIPDPPLTPITPRTVGGFANIGFVTPWDMDNIWNRGKTLKSEIALDNFTHLIWSSVWPDSSGGLAMAYSTPWNYLTLLVKAAHPKGIKVLVSVVDRDNVMASLVRSNSMRAILIGNLKALVQAYNLDGVDIDWESNSDQSLMDTLIDDLYSALHPLNKLISFDATYGALGPNGLPDISLSTSDKVDFINVMTYDMHNYADQIPSDAVHSTYADTVAAMNLWIKAGYPKEKLLVGIPTYGHDRDHNVYNYSDIIDVLDPPVSQDLAYVSTFEGKSVNGGYIWWNGVLTVKQKVDWVAANRLGGTFVFDVGRDKLNDSRSLIAAIYDELMMPAPPPALTPQIIPVSPTVTSPPNATSRPPAIPNSIMPTSTFGLSIGDMTYTESSNRIDAMRFQNTVGTGTLTRLELMFNQSSASGNVRMGVYSDNNGSVGNLLLDAGQVPAGTGWTAISGLNLPVTADSYYWLVFSLSSSNTIEYQSMGEPAGSHVADENIAYGPLPNTFPVTWSGNTPYVMRASVDTSTSSLNSPITR